MRFIKCLVVVGLCLLMGACPWQKGELDIDIGDYETHLEAWYRQNIPNYQIKVEDCYSAEVEVVDGATITVKNDIPEKSNPPRWLENGLTSTIPEFYSLIKIEKKLMEDEYNNGSNRLLSLKVSYDTEYHYPNEIISKRNSETTRWKITLMPQEESYLDINLGDYEYHLEAWNNQNMLNYQITVWTLHGRYDYRSIKVGMDFIVKNGIPDREPFDVFLTLKEGTIPAIYSFIKKEEERIRNGYNGTYRSYLRVQYNTEYHYPSHISLGIGHYFGYYESWEIWFTPRGN